MPSTPKRASARRRWAVLPVALIMLVLAGAGAAGLAGAADRAPAPATAATITRSLPAGLTPRQLAGQHVIYSYHGLTPPPLLIKRIRAGEAAGVILFKGNIAGRAQISHVDRELQRAAANSPVKLPLLIMTDQEGGQVRRLPGAPALSEKEIGESTDPAAKASDAGRNAARNLEQVGINVNLAPVLDVYYQPGDFDDQYGRSYGNSPQQVSQLAAAFIEAQQRQGVAATAKHFPGLGAAGAAQDTDDEPVRLSQPLRAIRGVDELPYRAAISSGVRLVMVSWANYAALDPHRPAGLSHATIEQELRQRLGFTGVTVTDALEAGALQHYGGTGNRALLATRAGMDLLLCSGQHVDEGVAATDALAAALDDNRLDKAAFSAATQRIETLRASVTRVARTSAPAPSSVRSR